MTPAPPTRPVPPPYMRSGDYPRIMARAIQIVVAHYGCSPAQLRGRRRTRRLAWARQVLHWLLTEIGAESATELGRKLKRDRSDIQYSHRAVQAARQTYPEIARETDAIIDSLLHKNHDPMTP